MNEDQRSAHYNAWANSRKWTTIEVIYSSDKRKWVATCKELGVVLERGSKAQAIYAIHSDLAYKGYEISNLLEVQS